MSGFVLFENPVNLQDFENLQFLRECMNIAATL